MKKQNTLMRAVEWGTSTSNWLSKKLTGLLVVRDKISLNKLTNYTITINSIQIVATFVALALVILSEYGVIPRVAYSWLIGVTCSIVIWGAVLDIREAMSVDRVTRKSDMLRDACSQLEELNVRLRGQRHDFMNHLQVVYSLIEMDEHADAKEYIERVYADIRSVSRAMKTESPAVNALLMAKLSAADEKKITVEMDITSNLKGLPIPGWEMCRILGNLIDNAMDALMEVENRKLHIQLSEDLHNFTFVVSNNGPMIPKELREKIFETGFTTKTAGHGMGLRIVGDIIHSYNGELTVSSDMGKTSFMGHIPRVITKAISTDDQGDTI